MGVTRRPGGFIARDPLPVGKITGSTSLLHTVQIAARLRRELALDPPPAEKPPATHDPVGPIDRGLPADLSAVLSLARSPRLLVRYQTEPLPSGMGRVIRMAANCQQTLEEARQLAGKDPLFLYAASNFYVEHVVWTRDADDYRALGSRPDAPEAEFVENAQWLLRLVAQNAAWDNPHAAANLRHRVLMALRHVTGSPLEPAPLPDTV